jgi:hypothetical protein
MFRSWEDAERFLAGFWVCLERHHLPSPSLRVVSSHGSIEITAFFDDEEDLRLVISEVPQLAGGLNRNA